MNICILGGGNIGTVLLGDIGAREEYQVSLFTSKPDAWNKEIEVIDLENHTKVIGRIDEITDSPKVLQNADIILSTLPSNVFTSMIEKIEDYIRPGTYLGIVPGSGGCEFCCRKLIEKGCVVFGLQRVHAIARIKEYGKSVYATSRKKEIQIGAIPRKKTREVCHLMENMLRIPCRALDNYLCVTLTPSNPILHTTRLYSMFKDYSEKKVYDKNFLFYEEWTDESSEMLIACDEELQKICSKYTELDLREVKSLKEHYESDTKEKMTSKISGIQAFKGILSPMKKVEGGYIPDKESRYFKEDFLYGLCIIKAFGEIVQVATPNIDRVLKWYEIFAGVEFFINEEFKGKDLKKANFPQNFELLVREDIYKFYLKDMSDK